MWLPLWTLPPVPGMTKFLWGFCAVLFVIGLPGYIFERRREIQKERRLSAIE